VNKLYCEAKKGRTKLPNRRVKIDINNDDGDKITISMEGHLTREKVLQILDFIDLLGGSQMVDALSEGSNLSKFDKIQNVISRKFPVGWFTSQEVMIAYEDAFDEPIGLSTVSTYLSRLVVKGLLTRSGSAAKRRYRVDKKLINKNNGPRYSVPP